MPVKLAYSTFVAVLVPAYWHTYGPTNFLYYCDLSLLLTLLAVWRERSLPVSMCAVGILMPQALWMVDFLCELVGVHLTGLTSYMFDPSRSRFVRGLSLFHFWLPLFLLWLLGRLGYDGRAFVAWTFLALILMFVCFFLMPAPPAPAHNANLPVNINYVYGLSDKEVQQWLPAWQFFCLQLVAVPVGMFLPTHLILRRVYRPAQPEKP